MFCHNCGSEMPNDALFCEKCGAKVEGESVQTNAAASNTTVQSMPQGKPINRKMVVIVAAVVVVVLIGAMLIKNRKVRVELNDYITVEFSGYDSKGTAKVDFDSDAFSRDYKSKVEYQGTDLKELDDYVSAAEMLRYTCVSGKLSEDSELKNGDVITFTWDCDDELAAEEFKAKLVYEDLEFTVSDLDEIELVDPFEGVEVSFEGISSEGRATLTNNSTKGYLNDLYYRVDPNSNLSNGDEVTVAISESRGDEYYAEKYGIAFSQLEKTYTVEGLNSYVSALSEITGDATEAMRSQGEDVIRAQIANDNKWNDYEILEGIQYVGSYLLAAKNMPDSYQKNMYYLIYQISGRDAYPTEGQSGEFSYYYAIRYDNLILTGDGDVVYDLSAYQRTGQSFRRDNIQYHENGYTTSVSYNGYEDMKATFNQCVTVNLDSYSYETNISE